MKRPLILLVLLFAFSGVYAITPPLEREINISFVNEPIRTALQKIQDQTGLVFSYRAAIIDNIAPVTIQLKQKTVREALASMLPNTILFRQKSNYIILKERPLEKNPKKTELSGYVIDRTTERKVPNVTIYDKNTLTSVTTDEYGFYSITVPNDNQCLKVNKENYRDTCVQLGQNQINNISIDHVPDSLPQQDTLSDARRQLRGFGLLASELFKELKGYVTTLNVRETFKRKTQVSFLPFLGTNGLLSGNVNSELSVNIVGGFVRGVSGLEMGGVFNIDRQNMRGLQMAGGFNVVGDSVNGAQMAGFFNATGRNMRGIQASGFVNSNFGSVSGIQLTGFLNFNYGVFTGFQAAGLANMNARVKDGVSMAGALNLTRFSMEGLQMAGVLNITGDTLAGVAIAGVSNISWYSKKSAEMAGLINIAHEGDHNIQISTMYNYTMKGSTNMQVAAIYNRTHSLAGFQLGIFNYADTASGVPIGFLSIVKKGVHQMELSTDELFHGNAAFRTGVNALHNIFILSASTRPGERLWSFGYGAGTSFKIDKKLRADFNATASHVSVGSFYSATSELFRFYTGFEYRFHKWLSLAAGPTFNLYWSDELMPDYSTTYSKIAPYFSYNYSLANYFNLKGWYGVRLAIRFL